MKFTTVNCLHCRNNFQAPTKNVNRGLGKFCSRSCVASYHNARAPAPEANCTCAWCSTAFYRPPSKQRSKSGLYFCSKTCKNEAARIDGGLTEIHPANFGSDKNYRRAAFMAYEPECHDCGYARFEDVLQVHHIDGNRDNNNIANLVIVCPTCHVERHMKHRNDEGKMVGTTGIEPVTFSMSG